MQTLTRFSFLLRFCLILLLGATGLTMLAATAPAAGSTPVIAEGSSTIYLPIVTRADAPSVIDRVAIIPFPPDGGAPPPPGQVATFSTRVHTAQTFTADSVLDQLNPSHPGAHSLQRMTNDLAPPVREGS